MQSEGAVFGAERGAVFDAEGGAMFDAEGGAVFDAEGGAVFDAEGGAVFDAVSSVSSRTADTFPAHRVSDDPKTGLKQRKMTLPDNINNNNSNNNNSSSSSSSSSLPHSNNSGWLDGLEMRAVQQMRAQGQKGLCRSLCKASAFSESPLQSKWVMSATSLPQRQL